MNNDTPETVAALQARTADLEQQLQLSDAGVARLAQRCLDLEQQVLDCKAKLAQRTDADTPAVLLLPQLFYDTGHGFSPQECLTVEETAYREATHDVSAEFVLPQDALAVRLDPGEVACCVAGLTFSDVRISAQAVNGSFLQDDVLLFPGVDPVLQLTCEGGFLAGTKFSVTYQYYPLEHFLQLLPGKALLKAISDLKAKDQEDVQNITAALQTSQEACARLNQQLQEQQAVLSEQQAQLQEYHVMVETMHASSSWRLTAPLRALQNLLRGH